MGIRIACLIAAVLVSAAGCAGKRLATVSPEEIPQLEQQLAKQPENPDLLLRYAAALFVAQQCDSARGVASSAMARKPAAALGPLVVGQCFEQAEEYDQAIAVYRQYLQRFPDARGADAIRAREMLALRARANALARAALAREAELTQLPADPQTIAVLPIEIAGDTSYQPLARGLAQMIISDLDLIQRFRMLERLRVGALLEELQLGQTRRVDPSSAARVGRLLQAGRMVQGLAVIPEEGETRLEASVVLASGEVTPTEPAVGEFRELMRLEKEIVVSIAQRLGYVLSDAERQLILENGTQDLTAFLAYSRGLEAEDLGDYQAAAQYFSRAVQADPAFQQAREQYRAAAVATDVQAAQPGQVTTVATATAEAPAPGPGDITPTDQALNSTVTDVASTTAEAATGGTGEEDTTGSDATTSSTSDPTSQQTTTNPTSTATGFFAILFRLP